MILISYKCCRRPAFKLFSGNPLKKVHKQPGVQGSKHIPKNPSASCQRKTVEFPEQLKESISNTYASWREVEGLGEEEKKRRFRRATRVSARYQPQLRREVRSGDLVWYADAGKQVGGRGEYPGPLQQFIGGLPLCQMSHYAERAAFLGIKIGELEMNVVGRFVGLSGYGYDEIEYEARITAQEPPERIRELSSAAANDCYVTNTLKRACKVTGHIFLNGTHLQDL